MGADHTGVYKTLAEPGGGLQIHNRLKPILGGLAGDEEEDGVGSDVNGA
jgi:hypothetical protein